MAATRFVLLAALLSITKVHCSRNLSDGVNQLFSSVNSKEEFTGDVWALLIAGSAGWGNYRLETGNFDCTSLSLGARG
jgi:hypothetical protein